MATIIVLHSSLVSASALNVELMASDGFASALMRKAAEVDFPE
jgi:hypothetical protein